MDESAQATGGYAQPEAQRETSESNLEDVPDGGGKKYKRETITETSFMKRPNVSLTNREEINGVTWYTIQVEEHDEVRLYQKRYNDFKALDNIIRKKPAVVKSIPGLPKSGTLGIRHKLDVGDFNAKRQDGLTHYLTGLLDQVQSLAEETALDQFFRRENAVRISFKRNENEKDPDILAGSITKHLAAKNGQESDEASEGGSKGACGDSIVVVRTETDPLSIPMRPVSSEKTRLTEGITLEALPARLSDLGIALTCRRGCKPGSPNQDSCCVIINEESFRVFAVFDGHGPFGHDVSNAAVTIVMKLFLGHDKRDSDPEEALRYAFIECQNILDAQLPGGKIKSWQSGSTGTVVYIPAGAGVLYSAHVGDSRAVLGKVDDGKVKPAVDITRDHKAGLEDEQKRVEARGGKVLFDGFFNHRITTQDGRGGLCVSRALGDGYLHEAGVIAVPETRRLPLEADGDLFLLVCSDGVWEFIDSQAACDVVTRHGRDGVAGAIAELAKQSFNMWMLDSDGEVCDDITAIVAWL